MRELQNFSQKKEEVEEEEDEDGDGEEGFAIGRITVVTRILCGIV
jgi:hypothetical protein